MTNKMIPRKGMFALTPIQQCDDTCRIYAVERATHSEDIREFIVSTPETRAVCNDPFVLGMDYTDRLRAAGARVLSHLRTAQLFCGSERSTHVLTILRGGLNFQLREALADAFSWNSHGSWFISAQRRLQDNGSGDWEIIEDSYNKMYSTPEVDVIFGDVVATGTSLEHGLEKIRQELSPTMRCKSLLFFTIGGARSGELLSLWKRQVAKSLGQDVACSVVYFEGIFGVAGPSTPVQIKLPGTDLLRRDGVMAPEFIDSQYEDPAFPLERCTIYDAGSRAFCAPEYLEDLHDYWEQVKKQANAGVTFASLLAERCPEIDPKKFGVVNLSGLVERQLERIKQYGLG
jgi:hypothetical protein